MRQRERSLGKRIIKTLENKMKSPEERVHDKCGSLEFGLDLVILKHDAFGYLRAYGVQIKTYNLSGRGSKLNDKIKQVIGQLAIAFGQKVNIDGKDYKLDGLYLVTNAEISEYARKCIESAGSHIRPLYLIDKQALNEFFVKNESNISIFRET